LVVLLDEPEAALHRRAERHLVDGLRQLSEHLNATVVVSTHSPSFLGVRDAQLVHVYRDSNGHTTLGRLPSELRSRIDDLGIDPTDLLQLCRTVVLVEGLHEEVIFSTLFADELAAVGALLFSMRGVTRLASTADAQLLFGYTDARLLVVVDNEDSERVTGIWRRACTAVDNDGDPLPILGELTASKQHAEARFLQEFCQLAVRSGNRTRVQFHMMSLPDIPEYLPVHAVAPGAPSGSTWQSLRERHQRSAAGMRFKEWVTREYQADYSEEALRSAAQALDHLHPDLTDLLDALRV
jgi:hypothetical protein